MPQRRAAASMALLITALAGVAGLARGQQAGPAALSEYDGEFYFARLAYQSPYGRRGFGRGGFGRSSWLTDYPEAETHLLQGIGRLTRITAGAQGVAVDLSDDQIMNYPWLYAVEVGRWYLDEPEAARLREYLLRGGFLMVDDFWGTRQWKVFFESMNRVFPDRPIVEIDDDHEMLHVLDAPLRRAPATQARGRRRLRIGTCAIPASANGGPVTS